MIQKKIALQTVCSSTPLTWFSRWLVLIMAYRSLVPKTTQHLSKYAIIWSALLINLGLRSHLVSDLCCLGTGIKYALRSLRHWYSKDPSTKPPSTRRRPCTNFGASTCKFTLVPSENYTRAQFCSCSLLLYHSSCPISWLGLFQSSSNLYSPHHFNNTTVVLVSYSWAHRNLTRQHVYKTGLDVA